MRLDFIDVAGFRGFRDRTRFELAPAFVVVSGRNGVGKSTLIDALDYALTGTIGKYAVQNAKGGGLAEHIWWVGRTTAPEHFVEVGFVNGNGERISIKRDRNGHVSSSLDTLGEWLGLPDEDSENSISMLARTSIIRDELIAALSLDLPGQARFAAVRDALGAIAGPDHSKRTESVLRDARTLSEAAARKAEEAQAELGRTLSMLTNARSAAERSPDVARAVATLRRFTPALQAEDVAGAARELLVRRQLRLAAIKAALTVVKANLPEWTEVRGEHFLREVELAAVELQDAKRREFRANERLEEAKARYEEERSLNETTARWAALADHGEALGLVDHHCPLCEASRTSAEFAASLTRIRERLAERGERLSELLLSVSTAQQEAEQSTESRTRIEDKHEKLELRRRVATDLMNEVQATYTEHAVGVPLEDVSGVERILHVEDEHILAIEHAHFTIGSSLAGDQVLSLERQVAELREVAEQASNRATEAAKGVELARQIDNAARTVRNEILMEQFDTVMPLLKELYRRLRPHTDWTEIESDFGGKVRASLNFTVGEGRNPQFLFSSGQRRAAGLAFLLAIHLSRPWCKFQTLLLDDPVQHIDDYRALNLVEVLSAIRKSQRQILVAVEDSALADALCRRLRSTSSSPGCRYDLSLSGDGASRVDSVQAIAPLPQDVLRLAAA